MRIRHNHITPPPPPPIKISKNSGFTLIEISIVLVIIGLIIGGILVGQDLIKASETRAQISQIEKYNTAVNTFYGKYGGMPGDLVLTLANQFGFNTTGCNGGPGTRNGDGLVDGCFANQSTQRCETLLFWQDLSDAGYINGYFPNSGASSASCSQAISLSNVPGTSYLGDYLPVGKIGRGNFLYVYEEDGFNYFGLSAATYTDVNSVLFSNANIPVNQAYNIDKKMDDGLAMTGSVQANYVNATCCYGTYSTTAPNATPDSNSTCFNSTTNTYSTNINSGTDPNCALSFQMISAGR